MSTRDEINEAIREMLEEVTAIRVGLGQTPVPPDPSNPPTGWPGSKYIVVWPVDAGPGEGGYADPERDRDLSFQITCVGKDPRQTAWVSSKVEAAMTAKNAGGGFLHDISLTGHSVHWRLVASLGAIVASGEQLFASDDVYTIRVGRDSVT